MITKGLGQQKNGIFGGIPDLFGIFKNIIKTYFLPFDLDLAQGLVKLTQKKYVIYFVHGLFEISWVGRQMSSNYRMTHMLYMHAVHIQPNARVCPCGIGPSPALSIE